LRLVCILLVAAGEFCPGFALDPAKSLTQYSSAVWTQQQGLPQDAIHAIAQTTDGYLWLGTDEGLARFDGYDFVVFRKETGGLPSNSITSLAAGKDGSLWIGTPSGLSHYHNEVFRTYTRGDGMVADSVSSVMLDHAQSLWIVSAGSLSRFDGTKFVNFLREKDIPITTVRSIVEDGHHNIYAIGFSAIARLDNGKFVTVAGPSILGKDFPLTAQVDRDGTIWMLGTHAVIARRSDGSVRRYGAVDGLPASFGLDGAVELDRNGGLWIGTAGGLARLEGQRFQTRIGIEHGAEHGSVRCIFEDREGNLWLGTNNGLVRLRDDVFRVYGEDEGLPDDEPAAVREDKAGRIWAGFRSGLILFSGGKAPPGTPEGGIFAIRETRQGELLVAGRDGLSMLTGGRFRTIATHDPLGRKSVYDVLEDSHGRIWMATPSGVAFLKDDSIEYLVSNTPPVDSTVSTLTEAGDGSIWAGSHGRGLLHVEGNGIHRYTTADGLTSNNIQYLYGDRGGSIWIGTLGGGLNEMRDGKFIAYKAADGLLSDNVSNIIDDGQSLWLSTTRGICQIPRSQLMDFSQHRIGRLEPVNFGVAEGLRSAQGPGGIGGGGGDRHRDGSLWFLTSGGIAVYKPDPARPPLPAPPIHLVDMVADGQRLNWNANPKAPPGNGRLLIRYGATLLGAPDRIQYSYKLEGLDSDWVWAGRRRAVDYDNLAHGHYRFLVKAELPGSPVSQAAWEFDLLPHFYQTLWFRLLLISFLIATGWVVYRSRVNQIRLRFGFVLQERARLAREIHDTLLQAFVGISSQLDVVEMRIPKEASAARSSLDLARRMAHHSLTEARRSVLDLRATALEDHDLGAALRSGVSMWTAGSEVRLDVDVNGGSEGLPEEVAHHVLRIAQEGVTNAMKHAGASKLALSLCVEEKRLKLEVRDNGRGFEPDTAFASSNGHFGLIGMRERAERLGGELRVESQTGAGTTLDLTVPLP
jgi:ligand-binding sensor domain-containing protein/two-component sensor histidine kinase